MGCYKRCEHTGRNRDRCSDSWWGSFRGHRVSLAKWADRDVTTKGEAEGVLDEFKRVVREAMQAGLHGPTLKARLAAGLNAQPTKAQPLTFSEFADLYMERYVEMNKLKSADLIRYRMGAIKAFFGNRLLSEIRTGDIEDFLADRRKPVKVGDGDTMTERVRMPATINRYRSQLVQMFNWAVTRDYLERTPFNKTGVRQTLVKALHEDNARTRRLSADEEKRLLASASPHLRMMVTAALYTGIRRGEMMALTWADLAVRPGWIRLRGTTTKSKKTRWVPVLPNVQAVFDFLGVDAAGEPKPDDARVFSNEVGEPIRSFRTAWVKALVRAGIRDYRWHDLRHEYASRLAESGVPLVQVKELLGHASIVTTERYNTNRAERLHAAVQVLKPVTDSDSDQRLNTHPDAENDDATGVSQSLHSNVPARIDPAGNQRVF
jgi:integrase